jgi:hypothetical protein
MAITGLVIAVAVAVAALLRDAMLGAARRAGGRPVPGGIHDLER